MTDEQLREYAWNYFALHAEQRTKTFEFFLVVAGLSAGGITALLTSEVPRWWISPLGVGLAFLSLVFWKLDQRNKQLVRNGEAALLAWEDNLPQPNDQDGLPHVFKMIRRDSEILKRTKKEWVRGGWRYSICFRWVFIFFILLGLLFAITPAFVPQKDTRQMQVEWKWSW